MLNADNISEDQLKELIQGCVRNHRKSQESIYKMFYGKMMAICRRYTKNTDQAKDILQDGFIKVFKNIEKFNFEGSFEGWVRRIVVNTAIDFTRKAKNDYLLMNENQSIDDFDEDLLEEEDDEPYDNPLKVGDVIEGMNKLSNAYRTVFNLYVFDNYTHQEIADALDISVGTSKSNLAKARANLKKILTKELEKRNGE
ncbi:MAG: sigma-70 family RNA polymerase sigma factor [Flavobacteriales bacterium]|nr:sigma-70 family RNA polymerase sigma factor [Flavobacteriales bacterium]